MLNTNLGVQHQATLGDTVAPYHRRELANSPFHDGLKTNEVAEQILAQAVLAGA